jgi:hypothetical protein
MAFLVQTRSVLAGAIEAAPAAHGGAAVMAFLVQTPTVLAGAIEAAPVPPLEVRG